MGIKYLWDTNIAIYYLQKQFSSSAEKFIDKILEEDETALSVITEIELLCWKGATSKDILQIKKLISRTILYNLDEDIKQETVSIRKNYRLKLPDAIIAASAQVNDLVLLTRNVDDFKNIKGLKIINPY
jgi:predicted nucleic acid-binding protein